MFVVTDNTRSGEYMHHMNEKQYRFLSLISFGICAGAETATSPAEIERHLELGKDFLARGQLGDALTHYHAAVGECQSINFEFMAIFFNSFSVFSRLWAINNNHCQFFSHTLRGWSQQLLNVFQKRHRLFGIGQGPICSQRFNQSVGAETRFHGSQNTTWLGAFEAGRLR